MSESRRQAVTICRGLLWLLLLSGSVFAHRKPTDAQVTKESRDWTQWSGISSLFGGIFNAEQGQTDELILAYKSKESHDHKESDGRIENLKDETHIVQQESLNFEIDKKVEDSLGDEVSEEVSADTYSEKSHLSSILQYKKTQSLEQRRQGIECVNCVDDGEGNVLASLLVQAIKMQRRKAQVDQRLNRVRGRRNGKLTSRKKVPTSVRQLQQQKQKCISPKRIAETVNRKAGQGRNERKLTLEEVGTDDSRHNQSTRARRMERAPGGGSCICRCEYPGETLYGKRGRRTESSHEFSDRIMNRSLTWSGSFFGMETSGGAVNVDFSNPMNAKPMKARPDTWTRYITVNGKTILPSDHASCKNVKYICPGEKAKGRLWKCPLKKNPASGSMRAPGNPGKGGMGAPSYSDKGSYYGYNYNAHSKGGSKGSGGSIRGGNHSKGKMGSKGTKSMHRELTWSASFLAINSNGGNVNMGQGRPMKRNPMKGQGNPMNGYSMKDQGNPMNSKPKKSSYAYLPSKHPQCITTTPALPPAPQMALMSQAPAPIGPTPEVPKLEAPSPQTPTQGAPTPRAPTPIVPTPEAPTPGAPRPETLIPEAPSSPIVLPVELPVMPPTQTP